MTPQSIAPVLHVSNLDTALKHYLAVFGFEEDFRFEGYVGIKLGAIALHLVVAEPATPRFANSKVYIFCDEVDDYYATLKARGATLKSAPITAWYGMRDFIAHDLDGNQLSFGCEVPPPAKP